MSPIKTLQARMPRLGRISLGYRTLSKNGKVVPTKAKTICFTSDNKDRLEHLAAVYGGTVKEAVMPEDRASDEQWILVSEATEIGVMLPSDDDNLVVSEWMECHTASGLKRRCDGERVEYGRTVDKDTGEVTIYEDVACICLAQGLEGDEACKPTMRLHVILTEALDAEGIGVWVVTSSGWRSNREVRSSVDLIRMLFGRIAGLQLTLSVGEAKGADKKGRPMPYRHFRVNSPLTMRQAFAAVQARQGIAGPLIAGQLPSPDEPTGAEVTTEELDDSVNENEDESPADDPEDVTFATQIQVRALRRLIVAQGVTEGEALAGYDVDRIEALSTEQAGDLIASLQD